MPNDSEQLKQDFLSYINFLAFSSSEILVEKVPSTLQKNKLSEIKIEHDNEKILSIGHKDKIEHKCHLTKSDLGKYGLSLEDFRKGIEDIKSKDPKKIFSVAVEEIIILHHKKLCEIYVPSAILVFIKLYEKFKQANSKEETSEIYDLILEECINAFPKENTNAVGLLLFYSCLSFISAYQFPDLDSFEILESIFVNQELDSTTKTYLNILNAVKTIQLTPYKETYNKLIKLIETLNSLQVKDKDAMNNLIIELKSVTEIYFSKLIQGTFYEQTEKYKCEKEITEKLRDSCKELIDNYEKKHSDEFKNPGILNSILTNILWLIGKFISAVLSKEKKMTLFSEKKITEISSQLDQFAEQPFFSRVFNNNA